MKINKISVELLIFTLIVLVGAFLRIYKLGSVPPHLTSDEAALGYNAYSILKTGKDEQGQVLPLIFKSFGDYKPGLYVYLTIPFVYLMGLNEFSTRSAGAFFGVLAIFLVYKISKLLFKDIDKRLPIISAGIIAFSPWHIMLSRGAWEVNISLTLLLFGFYFFLLSLKNNSYLVFSLISFALTLLAYQGAKLSTAILVFLVALIYAKPLLKIPKKWLVVGIVLAIIISVPVVASIFNGQAQRLNVFSVFSSSREKDYLNEFLNQGDESTQDISYYLFHSESFNYLRGISGRWFNHFSGRFLFSEGDWQNPRHSAPYVGMLNFLDLPLLIFGVVALLKLKDSRVKALILLWLILAPLPAVLSRDQVHAVRSFNMVIPLVFVSSFGALYILDKFKNRKYIFILGLILYLTSFLYFADAYFIHLPKLNSKYWEYGYKQAVQTILPIQNNYKKIVFEQSYTQPYIYFLFYGVQSGNPLYEPSRTQQQIRNNFVDSKDGDVGQIKMIDNIYFQRIDWQVTRGEVGTVAVGGPETIPSADSPEGRDFHVLNEINYLDNKFTSLRVVEIK